MPQVSRPVALATGAVVLALLLLLVGAMLGGYRPFAAQPDVLTYGADGDLEEFVLFDGQCARGELASGGTFGSSADAQCGEPHDVEVIAARTPIDSSRPVAYPGEGAMRDYGRAYCALFVDSELLVPTSSGVDREDLRVTAVVPSEAAFADPRSTAGSAAGARQVSCVISRGDGEPLTDRFSVI
ncbi:MAG: hypothetical protein AVDCRST_MAG54-4617 [uncultured Actinomycetospora sp.]|uniref:Septum formation-related domain-containing protein n=1 Tax=uncultured Actinomycetospora sp. TaxID=1135996 RepID=A0A6J4K1C7_9PSEU|nr:MAG: hypothetical protein AVDCRST_MAG54-4617 [uncultured Actinomycetospora sp.]